MGLSWAWSALVTVVVVLVITSKVKQLITLPPLPEVQETWWGSGDPWRQDKSVRPFKVNVSEQVLQDLKHRLDHSRPFTAPLEGIQHQYGINTNLLRDVVAYWKTKYNWQQRQNYLNKYPQFLTNVQGLDIHYIHAKPSGNVKTVPLLIVHGWPGSVREFYDLIPQLTTPKKDRDFVFEVVAPSIPGYGFSQAATKPGLGPAQIALILKNLMSRLGFQKFYVQGGDFGAVIGQHLAVLYPDHVTGFHSNMCLAFTPLGCIKLFLGTIYPRWVVRDDHVDRIYPLGDYFGNLMREMGHLHIQATKPDTIGVALKDSPVGLAAYILEKFIVGTNITYLQRQDGGFEEKYGFDALLDNVMIYWVTGCMPTAMRLYAETFNKNELIGGVMNHPVPVPTACARYSDDIYTPDGLLGEIFPNLVHLSDYDGGHFAAFLTPEVFASDLFEGVAKIEKIDRTV